MRQRQNFPFRRNKRPFQRKCPVTFANTLHLCIRKRDETPQYPTEKLKQYPIEERSQYPKEELRPYPKEVRHYSKTTEDYSQQNWNLKRKQYPTFYPKTWHIRNVYA
jgi:hypothetical protein